MAKVMSLPQTDIVRLDPDQLSELYLTLGDQAAQETIQSTMDDLMRLLARFRKLYETSSSAELADIVSLICDQAGYIGLTTLSQVAADVSYCLQRNNAPARAATTARMLRIAARSLATSGKNRDFSI